MPLRYVDFNFGVPDYVARNASVEFHEPVEQLMLTFVMPTSAHALALSNCYLTDVPARLASLPRSAKLLVFALALALHNSIDDAALFDAVARVQPSELAQLSIARRDFLNATSLRAPVDATRAASAATAATAAAADDADDDDDEAYDAAPLRARRQAVWLARNQRASTQQAPAAVQVSAAPAVESTTTASTALETTASTAPKNPTAPVRNGKETRQADDAPTTPTTPTAKTVKRPRKQAKAKAAKANKRNAAACDEDGIIINEGFDGSKPIECHLCPTRRILTDLGHFRLHWRIKHVNQLVTLGCEDSEGSDDESRDRKARKKGKGK